MSDLPQSAKKVDLQVKHALVLLIKEIASQIDEIASLTKAGYSAALSKKLLAEMCGVLKELPEDIQEVYFSLLPTLLKDSKPAKTEYSEEYAKYSEPAKLRLLGQIREALKVQAA